LRAAWRRGQEIFAEVSLPEDQRAEASAFGVHPALLDAAFHAVLLGVGEGSSDKEDRVHIPFSWSGVSLHASGASSLRASLSPAADGALSVAFFDELGTPVALVGSVAGREVSRELLAAASGAYRDSLFRIAWTSVPHVPAVQAFEDRYVLLSGNGSSLSASFQALRQRLRVYPDLRSIGRAIDEREITPEAVLADVSAGTTLDGYEQVLPDARNVLHSALALMQAWLADERLSALRLVFVTERAVTVGPGEEVSSLAMTPLWGLVRSAQSENPGRFVLVDLDLHGAELLPMKLGGLLALNEPQLALRGGDVLVPRLAQVTVKVNGGPSGREMKGTVLITGGTGGLGALLARHLVVAHRADNLVLTSRRGANAPGAQELEAELTELGARVTIAACDMADREQVKSLLDAVPDAYPLTTVLHASAVFDNSLIAGMTAEQMDRVLAPKLHAAWHLHELTAHLDLETFVLFSSMAATFGGPGQGNYAAANAFLDALAEHRHSQGMAAISMAWGLWTEVGMGRYLDEREMDRMVGSAIFHTLSPARGLELFDVALDSGDAMVIPVQLDRGMLRVAARNGILPRLLSGLVRTPASRSRAGTRGWLIPQVANTPTHARGPIIANTIIAEVARILGYGSPDSMHVQESFLELGFDSLAGVELRNWLSFATGLNLPVTIVFDHPSSESLAGYIQTQLEPIVERGGLDASGGSPTTNLSTPNDEADLSIAALFRRAHQVKMVDQGMALLVTASALRPTFDDRLAPDEFPALVPLSSGDASPAVICIPSLLATAGPHQYARFAKSFHNVRPVTACPLPGFLSGERLPATLEAAIETQADAVRRCAGEGTFVLVGHSTGGLFAHAVAARLEMLGVHSSGLVLIDTYPSMTSWQILGYALNGMLERHAVAVPMSDIRLTTMGAYGRVMADYEPTQIECATLLVRAIEPMLGMEQESAWQSSWDFPHTVVDVRGDHFTMMEEHAESTAQAVENWLATIK
jgi:thioesterase domain-containing protein/NAD(P)-dependent dehydrogenase (short-subunit alcohol dehydrogenase family)